MTGIRSNTSVWLFPGMATRRKPVPDGHVNVRTVNEWMYEACDLAGCSRRHNPHAVRKAFGTYLSQRGISKAERKLIFDHAEGRGGTLQKRTTISIPSSPKSKELSRPGTGSCMSVWN